MKLDADDLAYLRPAAILFALCALLGVASAGYSYAQWQSAQRSARTVQAENLAARNNLATASAEEAELKEKIARYLQLRDSGYIGAEKRLDWVEQLAQIRRDRRLGDLRYELSAQHPVDTQLLPSGATFAGHVCLTSSLTVSASLLHEGDLLQLIDDIRQKIPAMATLRECTLVRNTAPANSGTQDYALKAQCNVELITLQERST